MDLYIKFIVGIISTYGFVIFNFAIFRIKISGKDKQIAILALILGSANYYFKVVEASSLFFITQIIIYAVVMVAIRKYPLLYALAVCGLGLIAAGIIDIAATGTAIALNFATIEEIMNSTLPFVLMHVLVMLIYILIAWCLIKYKIGFSFIVRKFSNRNTLKGSTVIWTFFLILGLGTIQFISQNFKLLSQSGLSVVVTSAALISCIMYAYFQNKKSLVERFGEIKKVS